MTTNNICTLEYAVSTKKKKKTHLRKRLAKLAHARLGELTDNGKR